MKDLSGLMFCICVFVELLLIDIVITYHLLTKQILWVQIIGYSLIDIKVEMQCIKFD